MSSRSMSSKIISPEKMERAVNIIQEGGVVIFPARCMYGLAGDAFNPLALERIYNIKQRPSSKPLLVLIDHPSWITHGKKALTEVVPAEALKLMDTFWPGKLTIVMYARKTLPAPLTAGSGKIGVRMPWHPVARELVRRFGGPIIGTSANISGNPGCRTIEELDSEILNGADMVLDAGTLKGGVGSTVLDVTTVPATIIREGEIPVSDIMEKIKRPFRSFL
ncbi:MAG: threonylcarbamoyl-AMP synthase [Desulfamplus sp.]|nr:threonylcarbamoyl-AMP synthase [Desulfamplus sp.]